MIIKWIIIYYDIYRNNPPPSTLKPRSYFSLKINPITGIGRKPTALTGTHAHIKPGRFEMDYRVKPSKYIGK